MRTEHGEEAAFDEQCKPRIQLSATAEAAHAGRARNHHQARTSRAAVQRFREGAPREPLPIRKANRSVGAAVIFRTLEDGQYSVASAEHGIEYRVDRLRRDNRQELVGELSVSAGMLTSTRAIDGILSAGTFNFSNPRDRDSWTKRLAQRARTGGKVDFLGLLEEVCQLVIAAERDGDQPAVVLRHVAPRSGPPPMFDVLGMRFPKEHPSSLFGPGGAFKSYLMLKAANDQARAGVRVAIFDWELDKHEHRARQATIDPDMPDVVYIKCDRPLVHDVDRQRRIVRSERIEYGWFDSAAYGTDGKPEDAVSAMAYFRALRQIGLPGAGIIAHTRREEGDHQPFGSVFWHNSCRASWNIKLASSSPDGQSHSIAAFHRKANLGPYLPTTGISVQFDGDRVYFSRTDASTIDEIAESLPLWQRIKGIVKAGPQTLASIASELNHDNVESLDRIVRKHKNLFTKVSGKDGISRIALVERRAS